MDNKKALLKMKQELSQELQNHILPFWESMIDEKYGGYYGLLDCDLNLDKKADKGCILNSRILYSFSYSYLLSGSKDYLLYAQQAFNILKDKFYDKLHSGVYWSIDYKGNPSDTTKHSYCIASLSMDLLLFMRQPEIRKH